MGDYSEAQAIINKMAEAKMVMNAHKGNIEDVHVSRLLKCIRDEVNELDAATDADNIMHIIEEAADVQNFLLALVQQQLNAYRSRK